MKPLGLTLWRRLRRNIPLMVTVALHALAILVAGAWVVSETIVGGKKRFDAAPPPVKAAVQRQIEHRVQIARRSSAAGSASPVSANRIRSTAANALALPELPVLPQTGMGGFGGFGAPGAGMGLGTGSGLSTSLGSGGLGGRGMMSMSFLGLTQVRVERVVFVVDVGRSLMDIRKGGFRAFEIIRAEILRLVSELPPSAEFGVVLFDDNLVNRFASQLTPATVAGKDAFFAWMQPVNASSERLGAQSAGRVERWEPPDAPRDDNLGYRPSIWAGAVAAGLELRPETLFLITGTAGTGTVRVSDEKRAQRARAQQRTVDALARQGMTPESINEARQAALAKAQHDLRAINEQLVARGRDPFVVRSSRRLLDADFQAAVRSAGFQLDIDTRGWSDENGEPIWAAFSRTQSVQRAEEEHLHQFLARLQRAPGRVPAALNIFLFTGHDDRASADAGLLEGAARRNGGRFSLLTNARLDRLASGQ